MITFKAGTEVTLHIELPPELAEAKITDARFVICREDNLQKKIEKSLGSGIGIEFPDMSINVGYLDTESSAGKYVGEYILWLDGQPVKSPDLKIIIERSLTTLT